MKRLQTRLSLLTLALLATPVIADGHVDLKLENLNKITFSQQRPDAELDEKKGAIFEIERNDEGAYFIGYINSFEKAEVTLGGKSYTRIRLPNASSDAEEGAPEIESYRKMVELPSNTQVKVKIREESIVWSETYNHILLNPMQPPVPDVVEAETGYRPDLNMPFVEDEQSYQQELAEKPLIEIEQIIKSRNKNIAVLKFNPIRYNPLTQELRIVSQIHFDLVFQKSESQEEKQAFRQEQADHNRPVPVTAENADYLIVTPNQYRATLQPFVEWKKKLGYKVFVASLNHTGTTYDSIKRYLTNAYRAQRATRYVLLIGDHEHLPAKQIVGHPFHDNGVPGSHRWHTDFDYSLLTANDYIPDVALGRMPVDNASQLKMLLDRSIKYQKNPPRDGKFNHALLAGQFQDKADKEALDGIAARMFMEDLHRAADFIGPDYDFFADSVENPDPYNKRYHVHTALYWEGGLTDSQGLFRDLKYGGWEYGSGRVTPPEKIPEVWLQMGAGDNQDISRIINNGVGFVLHRDHGYGGGSGWAHPHYTSDHTRSLANDHTYPFVFSLNCATGWFDGQDSFAESWVLNPDRGAVAFIGAARVSYSGFNDLFHVGLLDSFWEDYDNSWQSTFYEPSWRPAIAMNRAKERVFAQYGFQGRPLLTARLFNYLGDPELELRTKAPFEFDVDHEHTVEKGKPVNYFVTVTSANGPVPDAEVTIALADNNYQTQTTTRLGEVVFHNINPRQNFTVTVNKHNAVPYVSEVKLKGNSAPSGGSTGLWSILFTGFALVARRKARR
ncbi:C25 family cysteine peptidase [Vibrio sp. JC009]|uniref:C25 family cysteine peptidase n=1 Tax=Vibrio sp. JC009 TaxID=2912314 RepID=UPI0023AE72B4|nr:C25 family cysteine peptidase [Vibrio sp. JC009]WED24560.1 C25 family cysteine peptidase [Vibrio sp. JC009]